MAGQSNERADQVYMAMTIRHKTEEDPVDYERYVCVVDFDPTTAKSFHTYNEALLHAIKVLASYVEERR